MPRSVVILDTSVLCCWLRVPGRETAGSGDGRYDCSRATAEIDRAIADGATLVLPIAAVIEAGNFIAQAGSHRFEAATRLMDQLRAAVQAESPWGAFVEQNSLWADDRLIRLANEWPTQAANRTSIGDATIAGVAEYYARTGMRVTILTSDEGLRDFQPTIAPPMPRRRRFSN